MPETPTEPGALFPDGPGLPLPEPPIAKDHLIRYVLSGYMLILAADTFAATRKASALLHTTISGADEEGVTPQQARRIRLNDLQISVDSVEAIEFCICKQLEVATLIYSEGGWRYFLQC
jgi:hypothetical protein